MAGRREVRWRREHEAERVLGVTATPAEGADGRFLGAVALFSDLTEIRQLEGRVALARHLADLGQVSAGAAHEFRNAAAAIDGFADLALRSADPGARGRVRPGDPPGGAGDEPRHERLPALRAARGLRARAVELGERRRGRGRARPSARIPGVAVERSGEFPRRSRARPCCCGARSSNLLRNAVEATPEARRGEPDAIALAGGSGVREVTLSIGDRGPGVDAAAREKIFLPFYSSKPGGSGFGLAIVARIAELHGGTVEVIRPAGRRRRVHPAAAPGADGVRSVKV